ncbi:MAG: hypothetical protein ACR2IK_15835 [Chloroflexota bacterium]
MLKIVARAERGVRRRLEQSRRLALSLTPGMALILGAAGSAAAAPATPPATLTGETLIGNSSTGNSGGCPTSSYTVSGTAYGPYPGTFTESGTVTLSRSGTGTIGSFAATFTITSGDTIVTGSKTVSDGFCLNSLGGVTGFSDEPTVYMVTIHTPSGNYRDQGTSMVNVELFHKEPRQPRDSRTG